MIVFLITLYWLINKYLLDFKTTIFQWNKEYFVETIYCVCSNIKELSSMNPVIFLLDDAFKNYNTMANTT